MKNNGYYQCKIEKKVIGGIVEQICWIPSKFATIGKILKIKEQDNWINGWIVYHMGQYQENPPDIKKQIRSHRRNTGDSLPKC